MARSLEIALIVGILGLAVAAGVVCSRTPKVTAPEAGPQGSVARKGPGDAGPRGDAGTPRVDEAAAGLVPVLDLMTRLDEAILSSGGVVADLGTVNGDAFTLGGWQSGWRGRGEIDGVTYLLAASNACKLWIPADKGAGGRIVIRAKGEGSLAGKVYLNDAYVGAFDMTRDDWTIAELPFESGVREGLNEILLRFTGSRTVAGGLKAAARVDYVLLSMDDEAEGQETAAGMDAVRTQDTVAGKPVAAVRLEPGESLTFIVPVPAGARLAVKAHGEGGEGRLHVAAGEGAGEPNDLADIGNLGPGNSDRLIDLKIPQGPEAWMKIDVAAEGTQALMITRLEVRAPRPDAPPEPVPALGPYPNAILIVVDALRADRVKQINPASTLDGIPADALSGRTLVYADARSNENWTKPSVATLLSGVVPDRHGAKGADDKVPGGVVLLSEHLGGLGFATAAFIANGYVSDAFGFGQGWSAYNNYVRSGMRNRAEFVYADAEAWLRGRPAGTRFFLFLHLIDPHVPYIPPDAYVKRIDPVPYQGPVEPRETAKLLERIKTGSVKLDDADRKRIQVLYDAEIAYHADRFRGFMKTLQGLGLLENTAILITADHGEEMFEHGSVGHGHSLYEELLRVPIIVAAPARENTVQRIDLPASLVDVSPTLCSLLGVDKPAIQDGQDLLTPLDRHRPVVSEFLEGQRAVVVGRFKMVIRGVTPTLFDLRDDPGETRDVAETHPLVVQALRATLGRYEGRLDPRLEPDQP